MSIQDHSATIARDAFTGQLHAECTCGWVGEHIRHAEPEPMAAAMADFAAHVHVAEGLATEDDRG